MLKLAALLFLFYIEVLPVMSQTTIQLYEATIPNSKPSAIEEKTDIADGYLKISNVTIPTLSIYFPVPEKANGTAVII